jgi:alanyl-tRNA synthetase
MGEAASHTAEHIFAGALTKIKPGLKVHKVDLGEVNSVYLDIASLNWDVILEAERVVNKIIAEARAVKIHRFVSLEEAERAFPSLRSREERVKGEVRVIEIDDYDYAACAGDHVSNTAECIFFMVSGMSRSGGLAKVEFLAGEKAQIRALELCGTCFKMAEALGTSVDRLEKVAEGLKLENYTLRGRIREMTDEALKRIIPQERLGHKLYSACLKGVDERAVMEWAGKAIEEDARTIVVFGIEDKAMLFILARGKASSFDCREVLKDALGAKGFRGGGKSNFANGTVMDGTCGDNIGLIVEKL